MKILHVESGKNLYGGAKQVAYLIEGLKARNIDSILVCPLESAISKVCRPFCEVVEMSMGGDIDIGMVFRIRKAILTYNPDIIHLHSRRGADIMGLIAAKTTNTPVVLSRRVDNREPKLWARAKYSLYDHVITISDGIKQVLIKEGVKKDKITVVHSAVDIASFNHLCQKKHFYDEFNLPNNAKTIGVIAQLIPRKGHRFLLQVAPRLIKEIPNLRILFFGKGSLENELKHLIKDKDLQNNVLLVGFREDIAKWIGCLDLVVHPAIMEGLGVSLLQATSAKVPIVASPVGGIPEIVQDGVNGYLVDPRDSSRLQEKISLLLNNRSLAEELGKAGREIVETKFSVDSMVDGNADVYKRIIR